MDETIECVFQHGGKFINHGTLKYVGKTTTLSFDPDMWSYFVFVSVVKGLGYVGKRDGDGVEHVNEGEEDGDGIQVQGEGDGVEQVHEGEEDGDGVEH
ncbi:hypothetical protein LR48_Vigan04g073200 [Vigna angularis]|uniref:PB1-like domain-containing protein n=1 Tax=Phaseolus angularis TaxID=3914 RepID=A0A0L9UDD7_PHAAN|nr:hypothetical protein LR48_Vigan04g073200 [Vigna angularis]